MIKKNIFCIVLMFLITECADYKPLYSADKSNFNIGKIDYEGDDISIAKKNWKKPKKYYSYKR